MARPNPLCLLSLLLTIAAASSLSAAAQATARDTVSAGSARSSYPSFMRTAGSITRLTTRSARTSGTRVPHIRTIARPFSGTHRRSDASDGSKGSLGDPLSGQREGRAVAEEGEEGELAHLNGVSAQLDAGGNAYSIGSKEASFNTLTYQGGRILSGAVPVYLIYYGNWPAGSGQAILENFINSINDPSADGQVSGCQ